MRRSNFIVAAFVLAAVFAIKPAQAACSKESLSGVYGYYHFRSAGIGEPTATLGQFTADGKGNITKGSFTESYGPISTGKFTGTYSISADCTGSLTFSSEQVSPINFFIVLDDSHNDFEMIITDEGYAQPGHGFPADETSCKLTGEAVPLAVNLVGYLSSSGEPLAAVGQWTFDGKGKISGSEILSESFVNSSKTVTGTYSQNANCTGTVHVTPKGSATENFNTVTVNKGSELLMIETDEGTVFIGTAQQ